MNIFLTVITGLSLTFWFFSYDLGYKAWMAKAYLDIDNYSQKINQQWEEKYQEDFKQYSESFLEKKEEVTSTFEDFLSSENKEKVLDLLNSWKSIINTVNQ